MENSKNITMATITRIILLFYYNIIFYYTYTYCRILVYYSSYEIDDIILCY